MLSRLFQSVTSEIIRGRLPYANQKLKFSHCSEVLPIELGLPHGLFEHVFKARKHRFC